jgi:mannan endo-1,4-beta-mannosidase
MGSEMDMNLVEQINADGNVDYITIHIWPKNWNWIDSQKVTEGVDTAIVRTDRYIQQHSLLADKLQKPLVIEEFGYPRDNHLFTLDDTTTARDKYFESIFKKIILAFDTKSPLAGCNFWTWGGFGRPSHLNWQEWDDYTGDPAQEEQGLNSVFDTDSTIFLIKKYTEKINKYKIKK